ncbi:MAG: YajQ family cyclic di-GMP-binding protein [Gammaproteobacteria bacterium]|nr:YajQ family cyclic di-GMP-binding protein [Gammaproteobacteria bacterium]
MPSFDVVSEIDMHEVSNALDQSRREVKTRYDFKNTNAQIDFKDNVVLLSASSEFHVSQMLDVIYLKMAKRKIDIKCFEENDVEMVGMTARQKISLRQGVDKDNARKIVKLIKDSKLKVQSAIQGDQVRVTGKKRDDLQNVMNMLREAKLDLALQYTNFRD